MRGIGCEAPFYRDWRNLAGIDELTGHMQDRWRNYAIAYFRPVRGNGRLILYQQGLAATYHDQHRIIEGWVAEGYTVAAMNMPGYGDNTCYDLDRYCSDPPMRGAFDRALAQNFAPPVIALNYAMTQAPFEHVAMVGVSSGAWVVLVSAALDPRIDTSFPVAGVLPLTLLRGKEESAREIVAGLTEIASVLDLAVMGADRPGRRQVQIFNRFDRCCFYGPRPEVYVNELSNSAAALGGRLDILFDESHARHKISEWALRRIMTVIDDHAAGRQ
jgi:pimeloyl-ACP methyl ester carboxylesterase